MHEKPVQLLLRVRDFEAGAGIALDEAAVADLPAGFGIEGRLIDDNGAAVAGAELIDPLAVLDERDDLAGRTFRVIAEEFGRAQFLFQLEPYAFGRRFPGTGPGFPRFGALALHRGVEAGIVDGDALLFERILGEVERKAESVVELEGDLAGKNVSAPKAGCRLFEQLQPTLKRLAETRLFELQRLDDEALPALELRISAAHFLDEGRHHAPKERFGGAEKMRMPHGAAHDAAKHIAPPLIRRQHAIGDEEGGSAQMIGDDAVARPRFAFGGNAGQRLRRRDQRLEQVDVVIVVRALQHRGDALKPHAGVDGGMRERHALAAGELLILHEDEVPDLDEAVSVLIRAAGRPAFDVRTVIVENLRAGPARADIAHRPEIVGAGDADDLLVRKAGDLSPQRRRLLIVGIDGDQQALRIEREILGEEIPSEQDGPLLEIIGEGEIAEHLEEGVMARRVADIVEVVMLAAGAHAFLRTRRPRADRLLRAGEHILERHHAGIGEEERRIVARNERARR